MLNNSKSVVHLTLLITEFRLGGGGGGGDGVDGCRICGSESRKAAVYATFGEAGISVVSPPFCMEDTIILSADQFN